MTERNNLPEWADNSVSIDESAMTREYRQAEERWRGEAARFYQREVALRQKVKRSLDPDDEDRALVYFTEHQKIQEEFERSADGFTNHWLGQRRLAHERVYRNLSDGFRESLLSVMALPDDALEGIFNVAHRSGQADLAGLRPGHAEVEAAREVEEQSRVNAQVREFYGNPRLGRRRGRRVS